MCELSVYAVMNMNGKTYLVGDVTSDDLSVVITDTCVSSLLTGVASGFFQPPFALVVQFRNNILRIRVSLILSLSWLMYKFTCTEW